jgi:hypothetical protein
MTHGRENHQHSQKAQTPRPERSEGVQYLFSGVILALFGAVIGGLLKRTYLMALSGCGVMTFFMGLGILIFRSQKIGFVIGLVMGMATVVFVVWASIYSR